MRKSWCKSQVSHIDCNYKSNSYTIKLGLHKSNKDTIHKCSLINRHKCSTQQKDEIYIIMTNPTKI
jgi:hypothetical protein